MSSGESFCGYCKCELGGEFSAFPATDRCSIVANWILDFGGSHAASEFVNDLLSDSAVDVRQLRIDTAPLHRREPSWKTKITITTTTITIELELTPGCTLRRWLWFWER
jgi:hypothetical protein